jgi:hypothetical protein
VDVLLVIRVAVVVSMLGRPPEDSLLTGGLSQEGHQQLPNPAETVASMAEIAVISGSDAEHSDSVSCCHQSQKG